MNRFWKFVKRSISLLVAVAILCGFVPATELKVRAEENREAQLYVISDVNPEMFIGEFLVSGEEVYISDRTLLDIGNIRIVGGTGRYTLIRDEISTDFLEEEVRWYQEQVYFPFEEALGKMCLRATFGEEERVLVVEHCKDLSALEEIYKGIYADKAYNMAYWWEQGYNWAVAADIVKNFKYFSYFLGEEQREQYRNAYWDILIPTELQDRMFLLKNTKEVFGDMANYNKFLGKVCELLGEESSDFEVLKKVFSGAKHYAEFAEIYINMKNMNEMDESYARGLELILESSDIDMNKKMRSVGKEVLEKYKKQPKVAEAAMEELYSIGMGKLDGLGQDLIGINSLACDIANGIVDSVLGTQDQVNATIAAQHRLDIQKKCRDYYRVHKRDAQGKNWGGRGEVLQNLHDITALYLRSGVTAYRAVAIDDDLESAAEYTIEKINGEIEKLSEYHSEDFSTVQDTIEAGNQIKSYLAQLNLEQYTGIELTGGEETVILLEWDGTNAGGDLANLDFLFNGTMDDGSTVTINSAEGLAVDGILAVETGSENDWGTGRIEARILSEDGTEVVEIESENDGETGRIKIRLLSVDGVFNLSLEDGESMMLYNDFGGINNANVKITFSTEGQESQVETSDFLIRSYTGMWFLGLCIDHGKLVPYEL